MKREQLKHRNSYILLCALAFIFLLQFLPHSIQAVFNLFYLRGEAAIRYSDNGLTILNLTETGEITNPERLKSERDVEKKLDPDKSYTSKDDVAAYIYTYGKLPGNFISKREARKLGWSGGSLEPYAPGKCIGGDNFGNYEGLLPEKEGRKYKECDIDTLGKERRGAKRIIYSNDGLIYYTGDHYSSFTLLYDSSGKVKNNK